MGIAKNLKGYIRSISQLRETRLLAQKLAHQTAKNESAIQTLRSHVRPAPTPTKVAAAPIDQFKTFGALLSIELMADLIGQRQRLNDFNPNLDIFGSVDDRKILTNGLLIDFDGGVNENLKTILRSSDISQRNQDGSGIVLISVYRPGTEIFVKCISHAYRTHTPLIYTETAFFGGFSSYFDSSTSASLRKSLGFIIDDMGVYFNSRSPSRLEETLNDRSFSLSTDATRDVQRIIKRIVDNNITKYNKYSASITKPYLEEEFVLVVDQKRNDASILMSGASNGRFDEMLSAAILENPGKRIYVKSHPDNIFEKGGRSYLPGSGYHIVDDDIPVHSLLERSTRVYTVSSQVGFEALLRGIPVTVFGIPFYAGWGITDDRFPIPRRRLKRTIEDLFYVSCVKLSIYVDPTTGKVVDLDSTIDRILAMRDAERLT
ncbi:capsular polysaccharide export protein, LipB/KpsS family [Brevundimonas nasdae]|uniref:capsular polysaccharide export protein, LipB/KpsS family n=1 Tax=Brevundimonas nasdae TaxID=172043 RepID=UPI003F690399